MEVVDNLSVPQLPGPHLTTPQSPSHQVMVMFMFIFICTDEESGAVDTLCFSFTLSS